MDPLPPNPTQPTPVAQPAPSGLINPNKIYQPRGLDQNLVKPVTVVNKESANPWKSIVLDVVSVLFAGTFGYSFARYLAGGFSFWFVFAALLLWGVSSVLQGFLQKKMAQRFLALFLESVALVASFYSYDWQALAITAIAVLLCLLWGYWSVRRELNNTIEIRFFTASGKVLGKVITAGAIFMVIMYASFTNGQGRFFISENGFNAFFTWAAGFVNNFYPTIPLNSTVNDFAQAVARMQLQGDPQFQKLPSDEQNAVLTDSANQIMGTLSGLSEGSSTAVTATSTTVLATTTPAIATEPTNNAFYNYLVNTSQKLQARFNDLFVGAWGLVLFLILRAIGIIVVWIAQFVSLIFYELLLATGFMKISEQSSSKEIIEY